MDPSKRIHIYKKTYHLQSAAICFIAFVASFFNAFALHSQSDSLKIKVITADDLTIYPSEIEEGWLYYNGDNDSLRLPEYSGKDMKPANPELLSNTNKSVDFSGVGWFRMHFKYHPDCYGQSVSFALTHYGASEIFLDGKRIIGFGEILGTENSRYDDPQNVPFFLGLADSANHVLAVRYANFLADQISNTYHQDFRGFRAMIGGTDALVDMKHSRTVAFTVVLSLLAGIFFALSIIHLFMFLYSMKIRTNLYFSLFALSISLLFSFLFLFNASHNPGVEILSLYMLNPLLILSCISLGGFTKEFTGANKWWLRIILGIGVFILVLRTFEDEIYAMLTLLFVIFTSVYVVVMLIIAMFKRVPGARIIGAGLLIFGLFIIVILTISLMDDGDFSITGDSLLGQIFIIFLGLSIISLPLSMSAYLAWHFARINKNLNTQLVQVQILSQKTLEQEQEKQRMLENRKEELEKEVQERTSELRAEKQKSDDLLKNILPDEVAEELKSKGGADAKLIDQVTVLFSDFKGFTTMAENMTPGELIQDIHACFSAFDKIMEKHGLEKIKTIGDAYMAAGGIPSPNKTHAHDATRAALEMCAFIENYKKEKKALNQPYFEIRVGLNTGPVVAGIVGIKKFAYDIWGDTVNTASRLESSGEVGRVNISESTWLLIKDEFRCTPRGKIAAKGKGEIEMFFVESAL